VWRFAPDSCDHDGEKQQDERDYGEDEQDQGGKHQLSAPLLVAWSSEIALARSRAPWTAA
jgi:hypothetical protein